MSDVLGTIAQGVNPLTQAGNAVSLMRGMQDLKTQQFNLQQAKLQPAYDGLRALRLQTKAAGGKGVSYDDINRNLAASQQLGADISGLTADVNSGMAQGQDPDDWVRAFSLRGMSPEAQFVATTPVRGAMGTAAGTYYGTFGAPGGAAPGAFSQTGFVQHGLTPGEAIQPMVIQGPDGSLQTVPTGQAYPGLFGGGAGGGAGPALAPASKDPAVVGPALMNIGMRESGMRNIPNAQGSDAQGLFQIRPQTWAEGKQLAGIAPEQFPTPMSAPPNVQYQVAAALYGARGEAPWAASAANAEKYPGSWALGRGGGAAAPYQVASNAPVAPPAAGGGAPPPTGVTSAGGLQYLPAAPGGFGGAVPTLAQPGAEAQVKGATERQQAMEAQAANIPTTRSMLEGLEQDLRRPGVFTGTGSQLMTTLRQVTQNLGLPDVGAGQSDQEHAQKLMAQLEGQMMGAMGNPSDARQQLSAAASPSMLNTAEGNIKIIHMLEGNLQALDMMHRAFVATGLPPAQFDSWRDRQFTAPDPQTHGQFDPQVFWVANMNPAEQHDYLSGIKKGSAKAYERLSNNLQYATNQKWIYPAADGSIGSNW